MKKYIVLFFIGLLGTEGLKAQQLASFFQPLTWEQASLVAARENKLVLVEAGPVEGNLEKKLEKHQEVRNFLQRNVVAIRVDVSSPAGKAWEVRLLMHACPVFAFFMPYGDLVGVAAPEEVIQKVEVLREALQKAQETARVKKDNSRSVSFISGDLRQALELADKEQKNVFVFLRKDRNHSSLLMEKNVFNLDEVADFYNQHFVNLGLDEEQAGELVRKYGTVSCPGFWFLNAEGKLLYRAAGYSEAEQLIGYGRKALEKARGIPFENLTPGEAESKARQTGRLIFTDFYRIGNVHHTLVRTVFADPEVTDLFTEHFVNVGREGEPSFLQFKDASGKELHRVLSVENAADLLEQARKVLSGKGLAGLAEAYRQGNREAALVEEYVVVLYRAGHLKEASAVMMEYLIPLTPACLKEKHYWDLFEQYVENAVPPFWDYMLEHRNELAGLYGEEKVYGKLSRLWIAGAEHFVQNGVFDETGFKEYAKRLKKKKVEGGRQIVRNARMYAAERLGDWKTFLTLAEEKWNEEKLADAELYRWGVKINEQCTDEGLRYKMAQWLAGRVVEIERKEQLTGKMKTASYRGFFEKLVNDLLKK